jgi:tRNA G46 methylase TrmB
MRAMGALDADVDRVRAEWLEQQRKIETSTDLVEVFPENIPFFYAMLMLADQWEFPDGFGGGRLTVGMAEREIAMRYCGIELNTQNYARMSALLGAARQAIKAQIERDAARRKQ